MEDQCKVCGKKLSLTTNLRGTSDLCADCLKEENKRIEEDRLFRYRGRRGHCKVCGKKLARVRPLDTAYNAEYRRNYHRDLCPDCQFVEYQDGRPVNPGIFLADYIGGYAAYPEPKVVRILTYPNRLEVRELGLTIPYNQLQNVQTMTKESLTAGRMLLVGIYAFALKKRTNYLVITFNDVVGIEQSPAFDLFGKISEIQPLLYEQMVNARKG